MTGPTDSLRPGRRGAALAAALLGMSLVSSGLRAQEPDTLRAMEGMGMEEADPFQARQLSLEEAIDMALRRNPSLVQTRNQVDIATYDRMTAYGSFLPNLSLDYGYSNSSTGRLDPTGQAITRTSYTMSLGASYNLFDGLRRFNDLEGAQLGLAAEEERLRQAEFQTRLQVKQAYFNAIANRELVRVEGERVQRQRDQLDFVEQQVELGRATRSDLLQSQVDLNNARLALLNARNSARASTFQLAEAVGAEEPVAPVEEATLETEPLPYDREQLVAAALRTGPAVTSAEASAEAAEASIASAKSSYLPTLNFSGGWAWQADEFPPSDRSWSLSLRGSMPLFNGFQRESGVLRAQAQAATARAQERSARLALRTDVDAAWSQILTARAGIDLAEQSVELSRESLRVVQERYRLGLATILELQQAQISLSQAQVDLINRRFDHQIGVAQLESLLGEDLRQGGL